MNNINPIEILGFGVIGLGFLFAYFAYKIINREQARDTIRKNMLQALYAFMFFSLLLCLIGFGSEILNENGSTTNEDCQACDTEKEKLNAQIDSLKTRVAAGIYASDLVQISDTHFDSSSIKAQSLQEIRNVIDESKANESHYGYTLFKIEKLMPNYGNLIDTRIKDKRRKEVYALIQDALKALHFYEGLSNGDQQTTRSAVEKFQKDYNERQGEVVFNPTDLGVFGYRTLEAVRSKHRQGIN